jgi:hypothetical protein
VALNRGNGAQPHGRRFLIAGSNLLQPKPQADGPVAKTIGKSLFTRLSGGQVRHEDQLEHHLADKRFDS